MHDYSLFKILTLSDMQSAAELSSYKYICKQNEIFHFTATFKIVINKIMHLYFYSKTI